MNDVGKKEKTLEELQKHHCGPYYFFFQTDKDRTLQEKKKGPSPRGDNGGIDWHVGDWKSDRGGIPKKEKSGWPRVVESVATG